MIMFDPMYLVFALPGLVLALFASWYTKSTFKKFSNWRSPNGLTGAQAAHQMLSSAGINDVKIEQVSGFSPTIMIPLPGYYDCLLRFPAKTVFQQLVWLVMKLVMQSSMPEVMRGSI